MLSGRVLREVLSPTIRLSDFQAHSFKNSIKAGHKILEFRNIHH